MKIVKNTIKIARPQRKQDALKVEESTEESAAKEVSETLAAFKDRNNAEQKRVHVATDSEFWFAVCFETREQKDEFLQKSGLIAHGDKYIDYRVLARAMGITLDNKGDLPPLKEKIDRRWAALSITERR